MAGYPALLPVRRVFVKGFLGPAPAHRKENFVMQVETIAKADVDELIEYIEGNKSFGGSNDKKRLKKERQKQQEQTTF